MFSRFILWIPVAMLGCRDTDNEAPVTVDADGDGWGEEADCDDANAAVNGAAAELCDGIDNDCDGAVDQDATDAPTWYRDADLDGFGDARDRAAACAAPEGYVASAEDCDDLDAAAHPGASEADCADPKDYNCDGSTGFSDLDGDGFAACQECDDALAAVHPGAPEVCDEIDNNCDGNVDLLAVDATTWYADADADGFGDAAAAVEACAAPEGYVAGALDCDDHDAAQFPGGAERCNGADDDCDGVADEEAVDAMTWYRDADGDLFGLAEATIEACEAPSGYVASAEDCDDLAAAARPGGAEVCDNLDNDCDGLLDDDAADAQPWFLDRDRDGYGTGASELACAAPAGRVAEDGDCDDSDSSAFPGGVEVCDGADDDCDGASDDHALDATRWYTDADADGFGVGAGVLACEAPAATSARAGDCDDSAASAFPGGREVCDGVDNDCDGDADGDALDRRLWYADGDGDGYGDVRWQAQSCAAPAGYVASPLDCDDSAASAHPGGVEVCDSLDNDCDGRADEEATGAPTWYLDHDGDGWGDDAFTVEQAHLSWR